MVTCVQKWTRVTIPFQLTLRLRVVNWISAPFMSLCAIYLHHSCFVEAKIYLVQLEGSNQVSITLHRWPESSGCLNCCSNSSNSGWATKYNVYKKRLMENLN